MLSRARNISIVCCVFLTFGLCAAIVQAQEGAPVEVIRIDANLVTVPVIVSDRQGRYIPGLRVEDFRLYDNSAEQKIAFFDAAEAPLNIALLLDTSRSTEGVLDDIKKAAKNFIKRLRSQDRAMIVSFDSTIHRLSPLTGDRKVLEQAIKRAEVGEYFGTVLNDAVMEILERDFKPVRGRKAMILLTDGQDFGSHDSTAELLDYATESDTMIYSIFYAPALPGRMRNERFRFPRRGGVFGERRRGGGMPDPFPPQQLPDPPPQGRGQRERRERRNAEAVEFLTELSEATAGRFYRSETTDLAKTFELIADELRYQYLLGFYPDNVTDENDLHNLRVKLNRSDDPAIRARRQYRTAHK